MKGAKNMSEIQNAIEVKNLKKGFGGRVLFENFSLNVKANTIHAIIGPNGSGKTTLLRLITGGIPAKCRDNQHCREICNAA